MIGPAVGQSVVLEVYAMFPAIDYYSPELLRRQVLAVERISPWRDRYDDGEVAPGIEFTSVDSVYVPDVGRLYRIRTIPHANVKSGYIEEYRRYGNNLSKNIAKLLPDNALGSYALVTTVDLPVQQNE